MTFMTNITYAFTKQKMLGALLIDIKGAFNNVIPNVLVNDLIEMGLSTKIINFVNFLVQGRQSSFYYNNIFIAKNTLSKGVPQGSVLSPILFNIYLNKIEHHIGQCSNLQFADDCAITFSGRYEEDILNNLKLGAETLIKWLNFRGLSVTIHKTKYILFHKRLNIENLSLFINNEEKLRKIKQQRHATY